jgi:hypothetical protein
VVRQLDAGARRDGQPGQASQRDVASLGRAAVEADVLELVPLVGADDAHVVAGGDVGHELRLGGRHPQVRPGAQHRFDGGDPLVQGLVPAVLLLQRHTRHHEVEPLEPVGGDGGAGDGEVGGREGVEGPGEHADRHATIFADAAAGAASDTRVRSA